LGRTKPPREKKTKSTAAKSRPWEDASLDRLQNSVLRSIPQREFSLLRPHLEVVTLRHHLVLQEAGEVITDAYFLNEGLASLVVLTSDGRSVEVAIVGKEGMIGTPLAVGIDRGPCRSIMQIPGSGFKLAADVLKQLLPETPELRLILNRFVLVQGLQVAQIAACNRLHEIEQRLARWLLMCQDCVDSELVPVTHEVLAQMLGTGRPSVSLAAGILQRAGLIENLRGTVRILDRKQLESSACECYRAIQQFNYSLRIHGLRMDGPAQRNS
jgi:CRP-like cAMP-binding protein